MQLNMQEFKFSQDSFKDSMASWSSKKLQESLSKLQLRSTILANEKEIDKFILSFSEDSLKIEKARVKQQLKQQLKQATNIVNEQIEQIRKIRDQIVQTAKDINNSLSNSKNGRSQIPNNLTEMNQNLKNKAENSIKRIDMLSPQYEEKFEKTFSMKPKNEEKGPMSILYRYYKKVNYFLSRQKSEQNCPEKQQQQLKALINILHHQIEIFKTSFEKTHQRKIQTKLDLKPIEMIYKRYVDSKKILQNLRKKKI